MRWLLAALILWEAAAAEPTVKRMRIATLGYAYWTWDGSGFFMAEGDQRLRRFDVDGKALGSVPLAALAKLGDMESKVLMATRAGSPDGKSLLVVAQLKSGGSAPFVIDLDSGAARRLIVSPGMTVQSEWIGDGRLVGSQISSSAFASAFVIDLRRGDRSARLCPELSPRFVHGHPDGKRLGLAGDRLYITDLSCKVEAALRPLEGAVPTDFAFSPSGMRVAAVFVREQPRALPQRRLWILSLDGKERVDTGLAPVEGPIVWLDEENLIYSVENGPRGTAQRTLRRLAWRGHKQAPLLPSKPSCEDTMPSAPARGGRLLFQRLCDDDKESGMVSVISARLR